MNTLVAQEAFHPVSLSGKRKDPPEAVDAPKDVHPISLSGKRKDPPELLGVAGSVFSPKALDINTRSVAIDAAIEKLPAWQKKYSVRATMNKKKQRPKAKVNVDAFESNALRAHRAAKYSRAFKGATTEYAKHRAAGASSRKDKGARTTVERWNKLELYSHSTKQFTRTVVTDAVNAGRIGVSPCKIGQPVKVLP